MTVETLAADIAARVPELARESAQNRQDLIARLIRDALDHDVERRHQEFLQLHFQPDRTEHEQPL